MGIHGDAAVLTNSHALYTDERLGDHSFGGRSSRK
jgi:hypothetical protein